MLFLIKKDEVLGKRVGEEELHDEALPENLSLSQMASFKIIHPPYTVQI